MRSLSNTDKKHPSYPWWKLFKNKPFSNRRKWFVMITVLLPFVGLVLWFALSSKIFRSTKFGTISQICSFTPEVTATTYNSKPGNATVLWLSGMDEPPLEFSQVWQAYSFKRSVTATVYDSAPGGATIIWLSGIDHDQKTQKKPSF